MDNSKIVPLHRPNPVPCEGRGEENRLALIADILLDTCQTMRRKLETLQYNAILHKERSIARICESVIYDIDTAFERAAQAGRRNDYPSR